MIKRITTVSIALMVGTMILGLAACGGSRGESAQELLMSGMQKGSNGDHKGAIELYNQAIAKAPEDANLYIVRAGAFDMSGDPVKALADYERAVALSPSLEPGLKAQMDALRAKQN